jgi:hypothetical protein
MKVYALPEEVPAPIVDYTNFDLKKMQADEEAHSERLKAYLISMGYTGPNTGGIYRIPHADSHAVYMYADAPRGSCLIHLPYCDGWNSPHAAKMTQKEVLLSIKQQANMKRMFA